VVTDLIKLRRGWTDPRQWRLWLSGLFGSRYDGLTHFAVVDAGVIMRCGQPRLKDLDYVRKTYGLRTVVCARGGTRHPLRGRWFRRQKRYCQARGVRLVHLPFSDSDPPPPQVFDQFINIVLDPDSRPVLVHCEQGFHRTGLLCAAYRVRVQGWPVEQALKEMEAFGFRLSQPRRQPLVEALIHWAGSPPNSRYP